ncbi:DUF4167 domain-containing protein [Rhodobacteraceae bacterium WD3A24]|nr:DUF4167 domain-containing protein [Rhodobacteraceae bacterium WD3A24]
MRSSKQRSRSKSNRPRSMGNVVNRVFDSSGPEGKVRGTPQQIIDKYLVLARDAQLGNDRVAAENFLQHAEHYTRLLAEAQRETAREAEARREQQDQQDQKARNRGRDDGQQGQGQGQPEGGRGNGDQGQSQEQGEGGDKPRGDDNRRDESAVIDVDGGQPESGLVETPESGGEPEGAEQPAKPARKSPRRGRAKAGEGDAADKPAGTAGGEGPAQAQGEDGAPPKPARRRSPRKPKADGAGGEGGGEPEQKSSAAE